MFIPFLSRLTGFALPSVEATTIQDTFVRQMSELAAAQGFWRYSPHRLFKNHGGVLKQVAAYVFAISAINGQVLLSAFCGSCGRCPRA